MKLNNLNQDITYHYFTEIDSTNKYLLDSSNNCPQLAIASKQTKGRGRRGNKWFSNESSLTMSMSFNFDKGLDISNWPIIVACSLATVLDKYNISTNQIKIKWPNDIYLKTNNGYSKIAGILIETKLGLNNKVVTGIGINLSAEIKETTAKEHTPEYPISHYQCGITKNNLAENIANQLYLDWLKFSKNQLINNNIFNHFDMLYKKSIIATNLSSSCNEPIICIANGINKEGNLIVLINGKEKVLINQHSIRLI